MGKQEVFGHDRLRRKETTTEGSLSAITCLELGGDMGGTSAGKSGTMDGACWMHAAALRTCGRAGGVQGPVSVTSTCSCTCTYTWAWASDDDAELGRM